jgi:RimJ/RimL family protein N-acetyltransferase
MKYNIKFKNKSEAEFTITSMDDYTPNSKDILNFTAVMNDEPVRKYITDEAMVKYNIESVDELAEGILENSFEKWNLRKELRFLVRDDSEAIVGMIGIDLKTDTTGELWFYKISSAPSFMYQALIQVLKFLKEEGILEVTATFETDKASSIKLLKELGFKSYTAAEEMFLIL